MASVKRTVQLDRREIQSLIKDLKKLKKDIPKVVDKEIAKLLDEAVEYCKKITPVSDNKGNHLVDKTYWEITDTGYRIVQEGEHVAFVEFGTGVVGEKSGHPAGDTVDWKYASGKHVFTTKDGRKGWFFPTGEMYTSMITGKTSEVHKFTQGQEAHMQMWKTAEFISERLGKRINYVIVKEVSEVGNSK